MSLAIRVRHWEDINRVYKDTGLVCSQVCTTVQKEHLVVFFDYRMNKEVYREFIDKGINTAAELFGSIDYIKEHNNGWVL